MHRVHFILLLAAIAACAASAQSFDFSAMQDAQKVSDLLKAGFQSRFEGGPLNGGTAVYDPESDLAFWVKGDTICAVNDHARAAAPGQPSAPTEITYAAVYDASATDDLEREMRPSMISMKGHDLSDADAQKMEESLRQHPDDVWARTVLLGFYSLRQFKSGEDRKVREQHVLWLVRNAPEAAVLGDPAAQLDQHLNPTAYAEAAQLMKGCVSKDPGNLRLLANAARFFMISEKDYAAECLKKCIAIEPNNPRWHEKLGFIHQLESKTMGFLGMSTVPNSGAAKEALAEQESALALTTDQDKKSGMLGEMAETALAAGDTEKARKYAAELLEGANSGANWDQGNAIYTGNSILGSIALKDGDVAKAKACLIAAGKCGGSPQLNSFGPDMTLASELLRKGERETVIQFLELCGGFWNKAMTEEWVKGIKNGREVILNPMLAGMTGAGASMAGLPPGLRSSFSPHSMPDDWDTPLLTLTMPTERLRSFDALYGVPLLLLLATVLWVRLFSNWQHLWILVPLAVVYVVPITLAYCIPPLSEMLFGLGGGNVQHLVSTYFGSLALLWLLSDLLARTKTWALAPVTVLIMGAAGLLGTINYPYRFHVLAEIITFIVVVTASFTLARVCSPGKYSAKRFYAFLFVFNVALMLVTWIPLWTVMQLFIFHAPPFELLFHLHQHVLISLVNGVGLFVFLVPFLLLASHVSLYREQFRKVLRIEPE